MGNGWCFFSSYAALTHCWSDLRLTILQIVYVIDGESGCIGRIDVGEPTYSPVLLEDFAQSGRLDLIFTSWTGAVIAFTTEAPSDPLTVWRTASQWMASPGLSGVRFTSVSRAPRDVLGDHFAMQYEIVCGPQQPATGLYDIRILMGTRNVLLKERINKAGVYSAVLPAADLPGSRAIVVEMRNEFGHVFSDRTVLTFHTTLYRFLKVMTSQVCSAASKDALLTPLSSAVRDSHPVRTCAAEHPPHCASTADSALVIDRVLWAGINKLLTGREGSAFD